MSAPMIDTLKKLALVAMIALVATSVTACGKKNKLEPPDGGTVYPRHYPSY
jgi:predicted small lipoprotein YifL